MKDAHCVTENKPPYNLAAKKTRMQAHDTLRFKLTQIKRMDGKEKRGILQFLTLNSAFCTGGFTRMPNFLLIRYSKPAPPTERASYKTLTIPSSRK